MSRLWSLIDRRAVVMSDGIITLGVLALAGLLAMWLSGCAEVGQFSAADAQNAASIATTVGDSAGVACWPVLETAGTAVSAAGDKPGILVAIEEKRAVQMVLQNPTCQSVWAGVLAELLKTTPVAPFVP
jgi:hypothetical protein